MTGGDRDMREIFAALRREEKARVPEFVVPVRVGHEPGRGKIQGKLVAATACLATVIVVALWLRPTTPTKSYQSVALITAWKPPTNFLLDTPGRELLRTVPAIGEWPGGALASSPEQKQRPAGKQVSP